MVFIFYILALVTGWLTSAWGVMLLVGAAHSIWWQAMPTMGYSDATALVFISMCIAGFMALVVQFFLWIFVGLIR